MHRQNCKVFNYKIHFNNHCENTNFNCPVGAVKLNPVPGADVVVIGFGATVDVPNPNDGKVPAAVLVAPNVTPGAAGLMVVAPNVGCAVDVPKPNAGGWVVGIAGPNDGATAAVVVG